MPTKTGVLISCCGSQANSGQGLLQMQGGGAGMLRRRLHDTLHEAAAYRSLMVGAIVMSTTAGVGLSPAAMLCAAVRCRGVRFGMRCTGMRFT
jgi:hypothetical protein